MQKYIKYYILRDNYDIQYHYDLRVLFWYNQL